MTHHQHKGIAILAFFLTLCCLLTTVGCQTAGNNEGGTTVTVAPNNPGGNNPGGNGNTPGGNNPDGTVNYTVRVKSIGGLALSGVNVYAYSVNEETGKRDLENFGKTDANGIANIALEPNGNYYVELMDVPAGYALQEGGYKLAAPNGTDIVLVSRVITEDVNFRGQKYELGDVIHDFKMTTPDGTVYQLSELLKEKDAVLLNFWYTTCSWCVKEFPFMEKAYQAYQKDIEILALNPYTDTDDIETIDAFQREFLYENKETGMTVEGLSFPMGQDTLGVFAAFGVSAYPTSVMIDRYGVICMIEEGAIPSTQKFSALFNHFAAVDYKQMLITDPNVLTPQEKPTVSMPSSDEMGTVFDKDLIDVTYLPEENDEYSWPFVIVEKDGERVIASSNAGKAASYATLYAKVQLKAGEALAFDYFSETEKNGDILYVLVDRQDIYQISGIGTEWKTCYPFVAAEDGEYELALCYLKNDDADIGSDTVYLKNLRIVSPDEITTPTYIPRLCATQLREDGDGYENYATVVFNPADGYYHVGTVDGPILLADLMGPTPFNPETSVWLMALNGLIKMNGVDYAEAIEPYASYASNSRFYGLCPVTEELAELLKIVSKIGLNTNPDQQWLEMCMYYDAYGTGGKQMADPIKGLADFSAFPTVETTDPNNIQHNTVSYDRILMPRGLHYKFVPEKSGAYRITSHGSKTTLNAWVFLENRELYYEYELSERLWSQYHDENNMSMVVYMEAGTAYYINIAFWNVEATGEFTFDVQYVAPSAEIFTVASPGYYTFEENEITGAMGETVAGGVDVILVDGIYYELREDGTKGSKLYADFTGKTIFNKSILQMIELGGFDFAMTADDREIVEDIDAIGRYCAEEILRKRWGDTQFESWAREYRFEDVRDMIYHGENNTPDEKDQVVLDYIEEIGKSEFESYIRNMKKDDTDFDYDKWAAEKKVADVMNGIYHGVGDLTEDVRAYVEKMYALENEEKGDADNVPEELEGCVLVDERLGEILQVLMDTYSLEADHSWTKLCYYYRYVGPVTNGEA